MLLSSLCFTFYYFYLSLYKPRVAYKAAAHMGHLVRQQKQYSHKGGRRGAQMAMATLQQTQKHKASCDPTAAGTVSTGGGTDVLAFCNRPITQTQTPPLYPETAGAQLFGNMLMAACRPQASCGLQVSSTQSQCEAVAKSGLSSTPSNARRG